MSIKPAPPKLRFEPPRAGWLGLTVLFAGRQISINTSGASDPFPAFLKWLRSIALNALPCTWRIDEGEASFMEFSLHPADAGQARLALRGTRERDGGPQEVQDVVVFIDTLVDSQALARSFYRTYRRFLKKGFVSSQWSQDLRLLNYKALDALLMVEQVKE